jgi:pilus assembly protein CpaC
MRRLNLWHKWKWFIGLILISSMASSAFAKDSDQQFRKRKFVNLTIGVTTDVKIPFLPKAAFFEGDYKKVTRLQLAREIKTLRFIPKKVGIATLMVLDGRRKVVAEYRIDVKKSDLSKVAREIRALLGDIEGIIIKIVNNKVVVDGQILLPSDMNRIHSVVREYEGKASTLVTLSPLAQKKIAEFIERDINVPEIHVRAVNGKFILEGFARSEGEKQKAEIIAKTYVPDVVVEKGVADGVIVEPKVDPVINLIVVKPAPAPEPSKIIQMVVHYVELKKDYNKSFSFNWNPSLEDGSSVTFQQDSRQPGGFISTITGTINNLLPKLNWAKEHGHARVLQSSSLLVIDGQKGELRSVTRVPYTIAGENGQPSTNFEDAGMITNITPSVLGSRSDSIQLSMEFALKSLVGITDNGPLISDNNIKTTVVVRSGQSAAVGGLISNNTQTDYNKIPEGASRNPIISLNTSKAFRRDQSQFVVFVTPIIKTSASQGAEKIKRKFRLRD